MKHKLPFFISLFLFLAIATSAHAAPRLILDPSSTTVNKDQEFEIKVNIDVENQSSFGADAVVNYPGSDLDVVSVSNGGFFTDFNYSQPGGKFELHGYFGAQFAGKSGSGTLATLKFKAKRDSGSGMLTFTCTGSGNDTQILNQNGDNILNCGSLNQSSLTYAGANQNQNQQAQASPAVTPTPAATPRASSSPRASGFIGFAGSPAPSEEASPSAEATPSAALYVWPSPKPEPTQPGRNLWVWIIIAALVLFLLWLFLRRGKKEVPPPPSSPPQPGPNTDQPMAETPAQTPPTV